jgi:hypothetical protein
MSRPWRGRTTPQERSDTKVNPVGVGIRERSPNPQVETYGYSRLASHGAMPTAAN